MTGRGAGAASWGPGGSGLTSPGEVELWGGHECTVNRVGDRYMDQTVLSGHQERVSDLDLFAGLGLKTLRYPVLWERVSPESPDSADWSWTDVRLEKLRELGVRPIVGLVHHGSGPRYTSLLDASFATGLARHAEAVARRYPWVDAWTPVNEPLTTARFSALYGLWHPHLREEGAFWTALLNQIDAVRLAMRAIREINPDAKLVQTEDLGRIYSTAQVAEQARFENLRRWATWDLLTGRLTEAHPLWPRIARYGLRERLEQIAADPCPPDIVGVNHYITSDRFLDHRLDRYPPERHGGNGELAYADVEAVRVLRGSPRGLSLALKEAWDRYGLPIAVTECHLGCTREEQVRWLAEGFRTVRESRAAGVDVRALTAWSLLGAYDWDSLLTQPRGRYETGIFDVRSGEPRPTAAAAWLRSAAEGGEAAPPPIVSEGWWRRDMRLAFPSALPACRTPLHPGADHDLRRTRPVLIVGATGTLGQALARGCAHRAIAHVLTDRRILALDDPASISEALERHDPWAVINAAGWVRVDDAEADPQGCLSANAAGAIALGEACRERDIALVSYSSDLVFDGRKRSPYVEDDAPNPLNVYGRSKAEAERGLLALGARNLVIRTAAFFSPHDPYNFAAAVVENLRGGREMTAAYNLWVSPTYVPDLVNASLDLLLDGETGLWHLANPGGLTWSRFGQEVADRLGLDGRLLHAAPARRLGLAARRPARVVLGSRRGLMLPPLEDALERFCSEVRARAAVDDGSRSRAA